ncbi:MULTISPECIES: NAD(P)/FAD-dependent oxidoreductase [Pseudonocardia]|uniref:NAD(P)/FAD-dependent oxidoreductase n=1 Tax=Pseudonocardia TaxID=1847 RepID=UPI00131A5BF4|nr:hypothetical protein [Pseudonocardia dioxanivorans]
MVGTRVAGASTALLLARRGLSVLALDRARFPSDTVSTHQVQVRAVPGCTGGGCSNASARRGPRRRGRSGSTPARSSCRVACRRSTASCGVPVGTVRSRLHAGHRRLADALLATAAQAHPDRARARRYAEELGAAMTAFQRTGDTRALNDHLAVDVEYQLFDGVRRRDRARFAAALASEFDDGVRAEPLGVTAGAGLTVVDLRLHNPSDQPLHCPPALTQLFLHDGRTVRRITSHYATLQPDAARA